MHFLFRPLFLDVIMFSGPAIPLTQKATKLCVAKLQPTNVPIMFSIHDLFQKEFHNFLALFHVSSMG